MRPADLRQQIPLAEEAHDQHLSKESWMNSLKGLERQP